MQLGSRPRADGGAVGNNASLNAMLEACRQLLRVAGPRLCASGSALHHVLQP